MTLKKIVLFVCLFFIVQALSAQSAYWVFFTDKNNTQFNPYTYFDSYAIERRIQNNISLYDSTDFPLNENYVKQISSLSEDVIGETRWFNALAVFASEENIFKIQAFPFVKGITLIETNLTLCSFQTLVADDEPPVEKDTDEVLASSPQVKRMGGDIFIKNNIDGKGIRIAVFDGGFPEVNFHPAFEHIRKENRIIKTWNFCNKKENVYGYNSHGRMVLSCIAGIKDNQKLGLATGAEFLLARTEIGLEIKKEEIWWLMAVEWADKNGAHIINSSLGYTGDRYYPEQMDGKYTLATQAANMAASKGILVVNAAGNEGEDKIWERTIIAPADADSILTIGGISPQTDYRINFSSVGPTADGRLKPNVVAYGQATVAGKTGWNNNAFGTSFASPLVAGFAACAWQSNRKLNNMELKTEIERSGDLYPYFDYDHGYGVPQASYFLKDTSSIVQSDNILFIEEDEQKINIIVDKSLEKGTYWDRKYENLHYVYYHIENEKGKLVNYLVVKLPQEYFGDDINGENNVIEIVEPVLQHEVTKDTLEVIITEYTEKKAREEKNHKHIVARINKSDFKSGYTLRVRYNGIVKEYSK